MKPEGHIEIVRESLLVIRTAIRDGVQKWQTSIGFHTSQAAAEMFELFLHKLDKYPLTGRINHRWLKSVKRINEHFPFDFPQKDEIVRLLYLIEKNRDPLCYRKRLERRVIMKQIDNFYKLKKIFEEEGLDEDEIE